jgi:hypothetical protein
MMNILGHDVSCGRWRQHQKGRLWGRSRLKQSVDNVANDCSEMVGISADQHSTDVKGAWGNENERAGAQGRGTHLFKLKFHPSMPTR